MAVLPGFNSSHWLFSECFRAPPNTAEVSLRLQLSTATWMLRLPCRSLSGLPNYYRDCSTKSRLFVCYNEVLKNALDGTHGAKENLTVIAVRGRPCFADRQKTRCQFWTLHSATVLFLGVTTEISRTDGFVQRL